MDIWIFVYVRCVYVVSVCVCVCVCVQACMAEQTWEEETILEYLLDGYAAGEQIS